AIVQTQPNAVPKGGDVNNWEGRDKALTSRYQTMRGVFVSQPPERHAALLPWIGEFPQGTHWRRRGHVSPRPLASGNIGWFFEATCFPHTRPATPIPQPGGQSGTPRLPIKNRGR